MYPVIQVIDLWKEYRFKERSIPVLKGVNFTVQPGEFVAIMGPSGAGKSTLLHILGCLDRPTKGKYILDSEDVSLLDDAHLSRIRNEKLGFVFQAFYLIPWASALENVMLPFLYSSNPPKDAKQRAFEALCKVGMEKRVDHKPSELSGGEQQRVAIARAIVNNPSLLLADEPTGNLDSASSLEIMEIFEQMSREGRTILLITHDLEIAKHADRILFLKDGKILEE